MFATSAPEAVSAETSAPPSPGPAIVAPARLASSAELAAGSSSRLTTAGTIVTWLTSKMTVSVPIPKAIAASPPIPIPPAEMPTTAHSSSSARPRSAPIISRRGSARSAIAPATSANATNGTYSAAFSKPTPLGEACRCSNATSGRAISETWLPTWLAV